MFFSLRITAAKLLVFIGIIVIAALALDAAVAAKGDDEVYCTDDAQRVQYLREQGVVTDGTLLWSKETAIPEDGAGWEKFEQTLRENGFALDDWRGRGVTVYCYASKGDSDGGSARLLTCGNRVIGFARSNYAG